MASVKSNRTNLVKGLRTLGQALNLRGRTPGGKRLGDEMAETIAVAIEHRTIDKQEEPDGSPLAALSPNWRDYKIGHGFPETIGVQHHEMLELEELIGETTVTSNVMAMEYGIDEESKQKAEWFQEGNDHQPARPFYDVGADGEKAVDGLMNEALSRAIREAERA